MPTDHVAQPWALRSTLVAVSDLDRSVDFYQAVGPFDEISRQDAVAVLGGSSPESIVLILRETRGIHQGRQGQQSLGLRSMTFSMGSSELDGIEAVLREHGLFNSRKQIADGASEVVFGRDPDNLPLLFISYDGTKKFGADYYQAIASLFYSLDI